MGIFSTTSPFDFYVERATSEKNTSDDWSLIIDVCDRVKESQTGFKDCLKSISKRLSNDNPRVVLQTITLLDACINNCGRKFLLEVAGRDFEQEIHKLITSSRTHPKVSLRLRESLKKWVEGEFKGDPELSLIPALYSKLQKDGYEFEVATESPKKAVKYSSDPNVVHSAQEEEDIAKAIQLSLQDSGSNSFKSGLQSMGPRSTSSVLYANATAALLSEASATTVPEEKEPMKVRALYDFEAAEDNELTFKAGEIIIILDNSDANWWKGTNHRGEGLFPANFVTTNLEGEITYEHESSGKKVSFSERVEVAEVEEPAETTQLVTGEIDEDKIDQLLHLLHEADPTGERDDDSSLPILEEQVNAMAPSIDAELECIDKKHAQLARISTDLVDALSLYHQLMREMPSPMPYYSPYSKMMPNSGPGSQPMVHPPHFLPSNPQNMPQPSIYPPSQYPTYIGPPVSGIPPQYLPHMSTQSGHSSSVHMGSPSHQAGGPSQQLPPNFQAISNHGAPMMGNFSQFNQGAGVPEFSGLPNDNMQNNIVPPPSPATVTSQPPTTNALPQQHRFPHTMPPEGHTMTVPSLSQGNQGSVMNIPTGVGPNGIQLPPPQQVHPGSMTHHHSLPGSLPSSNIPPQGPPTTMSPQGPPSSIPLQGPPVSMAFYTQPPMHSMQQPLL